MKNCFQITFYQPKGDRFKILYEEHAFPSDQYAINSQLKMHGYNPDNAKIIVKARKVSISLIIVLINHYIFHQGENYLRTEDIIDVLRREGQSIALVMISGVHYYTGQLFDIETITRVAHEQVFICTIY